MVRTLVIYYSWGGILIVKLEGECNLSRKHLPSNFLQYPWFDAAGVVTDFFSEHKLIRMHISSWRKIASVDADWKTKFVSIVLVYVETCVPNQIQLLCHDNYSRQMCLLVETRNAYLHIFKNYSELHAIDSSDVFIYCWDPRKVYKPPLLW